LASRTSGTPKKEFIQGFTVFRVGPKRNYTASAGHALSRLLFIKNAIKLGKSLDVQIVDGSNYIAHFIAKNIANYKKIPAVAWYPDVWLNDWIKNAGLYGIFGELLERLNLVRGFDAYIAISKNTADKLRKFSKKAVHVVYCGVDKKEFLANYTKFKDPTIVSVSRLTKYKNLNTLILAFAHLLTKVKNAKLIIIGTGPEQKNLKDQIKALNISSKVKIFANLPRDELISLYKSAHVFSLPSLVEGFGIATVEAAIAGLPYVNSDIPVLREITKNGKGGYLVDSDNPLDFSQKLQLLLNNSNLYKKKSLELRTLADSYNWYDVVLQTENVYKSLLSKNSPLRKMDSLYSKVFSIC